MIDAFLTQSPQTKRQLAEKSGFPIREVELLIHAARLEGLPIVSSGDGYWLGTPAEVRACAERLRERALRQMETAAALKATAEAAEAVPLAFRWDAA